MTDVHKLNLIEAIDENSPAFNYLPKKLTLEIIYGHAWALGKHLAVAQNQIAYIDPNQILRKTSADSD